MNIWVSTVRKLKRGLIAFLASRNTFIVAFLNGLIENRPQDVVRWLEPGFTVDAFREPLIESVVRSHGEEIIEVLSDAQKMVAFERVCETRLLDVIMTINSKPGGSFKYVGNVNTRVIVGAGPHKREGWLATDIAQLNIAEEASWQRLFDPGSVDRLLAEHVLEHLSLRELHAALNNIYRYLKPGGQIRLAVPDAFHPSRYYYNLVKPGGWETPYEHMLFLEHELLTRIGQEAGFEVHLLEYFDESGIFHSTDYSSEDGVIQRCARNNTGFDTKDAEVMTKFHASIPEHLRQQFFDRRMSYTSLIADLIKPQ